MENCGLEKFLMKENCFSQRVISKNSEKFKMNKFVDEGEKQFPSRGLIWNKN